MSKLTPQDIVHAYENEPEQQDQPTDIRGFELLIGKTIKFIDQSSINVVLLECTDNTLFKVEAEERFMGIEILTCSEAEPCQMTI